MIKIEKHFDVIPAQAGIHGDHGAEEWIPFFNGMTGLFGLEGSVG